MFWFLSQLLAKFSHVPLHDEVHTFFYKFRCGHFLEPLLSAFYLPIKLFIWVHMRIEQRGEKKKKERNVRHPSPGCSRYSCCCKKKKIWPRSSPPSFFMCEYELLEVCGSDLISFVFWLDFAFALGWSSNKCGSAETVFSVGFSLWCHEMGCLGFLGCSLQDLNSAKFTWRNKEERHTGAEKSNTWCKVLLLKI